MDWFHNWPKDSFASLQYIINALKDRYVKQGDSPCAPNTMQKSERYLVKNSTINGRFQDNSHDESTCTIAIQIHDSGEA